MTTLREAAQMALDAMETSWGVKRTAIQVPEAIKALRAALAQPEPSASVEPVAWMCPHDPERETAFSWQSGMCESSGCGHQRVPLYTAPPQREWQGLTDEERAVFDRWVSNGMEGTTRAIEAKLKGKNT